MKPVIGINCDYEKESRLPYSFLYRDYSDAIIAAGGIPVLLPILKNENDIEFFLKRVNGLLLTGGNDIPPERYGERRHERTKCVHADKDVADFTLLQTAIIMRKPILAICYGAQLVNVAFGGSLIQDIPTEVSTPITHKDPENEQYTHPVAAKRDSLLSRIFGTDCITTNSIHHQAIKTLGKGLRDTAHATDGIIEAIEWEGYPFLLGVQWHPERMIHRPGHISLFTSLIHASN
ncbi:MAG: gamma-glutamyl-gamma-aminobutyrate hydrolase family protein [wastewater metagenome]|nr:gamma-glutamyl-gamma-aminobutyrate hydrolase family protein [Candidatus Loosdrechtia aerotolerans]